MKGRSAPRQAAAPGGPTSCSDPWPSCFRRSTRPPRPPCGGQRARVCVYQNCCLRLIAAADSGNVKAVAARVRRAAAARRARRGPAAQLTSAPACSPVTNAALKWSPGRTLCSSIRRARPSGTLKRYWGWVFYTGGALQQERGVTARRGGCRCAWRAAAYHRRDSSDSLSHATLAHHSAARLLLHPAAHGRARWRAPALERGRAHP